MKPTFLFIGPDKSGSTWLYEILRGHPECYVPPLKDLYFFDRYYNRGFTWYLSFFDGAPRSARAIGELSHDYLFSREAAHRIASHLPKVQLIACLREPIDRTYSHYLHLVRSGLTQEPFESALKSFPMLINNSLYARHLEPYFQLFAPSQIKVLFFEKLNADAIGFARDVFECLNVSFVEGLPYHQMVLPASRPRSLLLARFAKSGANIARRLRLNTLLGEAKRNAFLQAFLYRPYEKMDKPKIDPVTMNELRSIFGPDIRDLEKMLRISLRHWL